MMYPQIIRCCQMAKEIGFTVTMVSNGSLLTKQKVSEMKGIVDWIGLSIDSIDDDIEKEVGRHCKGLNHIDNVISVADYAHEYAINIKLNITVLKQSYMQDFTDFIRKINPKRVKAFQVLRVEGENEEHFDKYSITDEQFSQFKKNHCSLLENGESIIFEGGDMMIDSYLMLDPLGRIMLNSNGIKSFLPFSEINIRNIEGIVNSEKYIERGGDYDWENSK